jgi:hypothetical protein
MDGKIPRLEKGRYLVEAAQSEVRASHVGLVLLRRERSRTIPSAIPYILTISLNQFSSRARWITLILLDVR